jgi:hypothetical protein
MEDGSDNGAELEGKRIIHYFEEMNLRDRGKEGCDGLQPNSIENSADQHKDLAQQL